MRKLVTDDFSDWASARGFAVIPTRLGLLLGPSEFVQNPVA